MDLTNEVMIKNFVDKYLNPETELDILDIGSQDVNGTFKPFFYSPKWRYTGLDIVAGPNVDIVVAPYDYTLDKKFDVVISGSTMEHVEDLKEWALQVMRTLKNNTLIFFSAPLDHPVTHRHPKDCWRVYEDGMKWIMKDIMGLEILELYVHDGTTFGIGKYVEKEK